MTFTDQPNGVTAMAGAAEVIEFEATLPVLIERASRTLLDARSSAEVLEARDMARVAYDAAKSAGRLEKAKEARDEVLAAIYRAQAQASEIETRAKARLADEYEAAQKRGEVKKHGGARNFKIPVENLEPSAADLGLKPKEIHEGKKFRDAEKSEPGKTKRVLDEMVARGEEPTRAKLNRALTDESPKTPKAPAQQLRQFAERRKLAKLTQDALIDEVLGLRADLADAKAEAAKVKAERDALKAQVKELSAGDTTSVIRNLQVQVKNAESARWREGEKTKDALKQVYALKKELKRLGATEIPL